MASHIRAGQEIGQGGKTHEALYGVRRVVCGRIYRVPRISRAAKLHARTWMISFE